MKHSLWKKLSSYLMDVCLEKKQSRYSGPIELLLRNNRYALCTKQAVYSYDDLYYNFKQAFQQIPLQQSISQKVLVLGLGLGSIPYMLEKTFCQDYQYTLVEIDDVIIDLAYKYRLNNLSSTIEVIEADAFEYVKHQTQKFDLIAVDLFVGDQVPDAFEQIQFLENVKKLLKPTALLLYNRLAYNEQHLLKTNQFFNKTFLEVFEDAHMMEVLTNRMLLNRAPF